MIAWVTRHLQTAVGALGRLSRHWLATLLTTLVIGIALALPACLHLLITNAQQASGQWTNAISLSVFLKQNASADDARQLARRVEQRRDIGKVELVLADDALKAFARQSGLGGALSALDDNPLPHALVVIPAAEAATSEALETLAADLRRLDHVDIVQLDTAWVDRLNAILDAIRRGILLGAGLLGVGVMVIVGNTIRLDIQNRRQEIEVIKLVGGSNGFVRRPFLYSGIWYGLGGGIVAWIVTAVVVATLREPVGRIAGLYSSGFSLTGLDVRSTVLMLGCGVLLGWVGSWIAASRHLREIEPS